MKRIAFILLLLTLLVSCVNKNNPQHIKIDGKEMAIIHGDTFGVIYETHIVKSCERVIPSNIHEEMNPEFVIKLEDSSSFETRESYEIGDTIIYTIYKGIK